MGKSAPPQWFPDLLEQADADLLARYQALVWAYDQTHQHRQLSSDVHRVRIAGRLAAPRGEERGREQE